MTIFTTRNLIIIALFNVLLISGATADAKDEIRIGGTGGLLSVIKNVISDFERTHPGISVTVLPSMGSSGGIKAVLAGALDVALSSRNLKEQEQGASARLFARSPFVFAVAKNISVSGLTVAELEDIYERRAETWPDGQPIRLILRPAVEFDTTLLKSISPRMDRAVTAALKHEGMIMAITDQDSADLIEKIPYALGTITLGQMVSEKRPFKPLSVNGVKPDLKSMSEGKYPYSKTFYLVVKTRPGPAVQEFMEFACSTRTRKILGQSSYQSLCP